MNTYTGLKMRASLLRAILILSIVLAAATTALGQTPTVVRVEEDWELVIATPDPDSDAP